MLLSKLVYLCVKEVLYSNDTSFTYDAFLEGNFDNDIDYATSINNVFPQLNEAIGRLTDLERIPYIVEPITITDGKAVLDSLTRKCKEVIGIGFTNNGYPIPLNFKRARIITKVVDEETEEETIVKTDTVLIQNSNITDGDEYFIEYKEDIPSFTRLDLKATSLDEQLGYTDPNIDLNDEYGFSESMCHYIIEYVKSKLLEPIAPELANAHRYTAENYFVSLPISRSMFEQIVNRNKYKIGI